MGAVKNVFMEEIEQDFEYQSLVNPRRDAEPFEAIIDSELKSSKSGTEEIAHNLQTIGLSDCCILEKRDLLEDSMHCCDLLKRSLSILHSTIKKQWEEQEREEEAEAERDYEAMQDVYAEVRASFI